MSDQVYNVPSRLIKVPIILNTSFSLDWVPIYFLGYFIQIVWTGVPTGQFYLEASGDRYSNGVNIIPPEGVPFYVPPGLSNPINAGTISGSTYGVAAAGTNSWNVGNARYNYVRLSYKDTSGGVSTASLNFAHMTQKGPG